MSQPRKRTTRLQRFFFALVVLLATVTDGLSLADMIGQDFMSQVPAHLQSDEVLFSLLVLQILVLSLAVHTCNKWIARLVSSLVTGAERIALELSIGVFIVLAFNEVSPSSPFGLLLSVLVTTLVTLLPNAPAAWKAVKQAHVDALAIFSRIVPPRWW